MGHVLFINNAYGSQYRECVCLQEAGVCRCAYLFVEAQSHRLVPQHHEEVSSVQLILQVHNHCVHQHTRKHAGNPSPVILDMICVSVTECVFLMHMCECLLSLASDDISIFHSCQMDRKQWRVIFKIHQIFLMHIGDLTKLLFAEKFNLLHTVHFKSFFF